jgi:lipid-binding SYLF domain-containing protein
MTRLIPALLAAALMLASFDSLAATKYERRLDNAVNVLEEMSEMPEKGIPPAMLRDAYAVAVLPNVVKIGLGLGGRFGSGVLVVRRPDGRWSNPSFVNLGGGSFGLQLGVQSTDLVLVFKTPRGVESLYKGKMTLGADVAVAAGPVGRMTSAATDVTLKAEVFSYSRNRGLFVGVALDGAVLGMDRDGNTSYYGADYANAQTILNQDTAPTLPGARRFQETLAAATPPLTFPMGETSRTAKAEPAKPAEDKGARTYGLDDAPPANSDVVF